ncbi:MAG: winged helix-turn-helix transcriptional regulator [Dehalococcoidia bacterium]
MAQTLQNKNLATKFQILAEIAAHQPNIQQKLIAPKIGVTPQAVSEYIKELLRDGFIISDGRSRYTVTKEGVDWVLQMTRELQDYSAFVRKAITNATVCAALAEDDISRSEEVGLQMKDGILYASARVGKQAKGISVSDARAGEDIGVANIEGIVALEIGKITVLKIPGIERGGSAKTDIKKLRQEILPDVLVGAIGIEALSALKKIGIVPHHFYGVKEAVVEAAYSGLSSAVVCVDGYLSSLVQKLENENLDYRIVDLSTCND